MICYPCRPDRHGVAALLAWAICSALYFWTANGVVIGENDRANNAWHHYEYLVDGFLQGHLYLSPGPSKELLALPDPYDPKQNFPYRLWDASLYKGQYYLYFGPTPALLLMLPWKTVTGHHLPQRLATGFFAVAGLGAFAMLLSGVRRRFFPAASPALLFWTVVLAGHTTWLPVVLRHPAFWELPIIAAAALFWWSLYFLYRFHESAGRRFWALAAGLSLVFTLGARPTYAFAAGFVALLFALPYERGLHWTHYVRRLLPVGIPLTLGAAGLLAYNYARFGDLLEFGQSYQLWGTEARTVHHFSLSYLPFNAWYYLFSLPELGIYFPFIHPAWPTDVPAGYIATEEIYGLLFAMPAQLVGFSALGYLWMHRRDRAKRSLCLLVAAGAASSLIASGVFFCFVGAGSRYVTELVAGWSVAVGIGMLVLFSNIGRMQWRGVLRLLGVLSAVWSILCVWLASYEFQGFARITQPDVYPVVARILNFPSYWLARHSGATFGPVALDIRLPAAPATGSTVLMAAGSQSTVDRLVIERAASNRIRLRLVANDLSILETPFVTCSGTTVRIVCAAPWLYPPAAHPYWRITYPDEQERRRRQTLYAIAVNGAKYSCQSWWGFDATRFEPDVRTASSVPSACAWVESLSRIDPGSMPVNSPVSPVPGPEH
jgi:hypothetical protein